MSSRRLTLSFCAGIAVLVVGCAPAVNPRVQDLAWERWQRCNNFPAVRLNEILPDGRIRVVSDSRLEVEAWQDCIRQAAFEQRRRVRQPLVRPSVQPARQQASVAIAPADAPVWKRGDQWVYSWETPQGKGIFVWSVDHEEAVDGVEYYVLTAGQREMYWRKSDLAIFMDKLGGRAEERNVPPRLLYVWPLTPGAMWEQTFTREQFREKRTERLAMTCEVEAEETITVPAGTFGALKIVCREQRTGSIIHETWYSPEVKNRIRERVPFPEGIWLRELKAYRLE